MHAPVPDAAHESTHRPMNKRLAWAVGLLLAILAVAIAGRFAVQSLKPRPGGASQPTVRDPAPAPPARAPDVAAPGTRHPPAMIDGETRLERSEAGPDARVIHRLTLPNTPAAQVDRDAFAAAARSKVARAACASREVRSALERGAVHVYAYRSSDGIDLGSVTVTLADCPAPVGVPPPAPPPPGPVVRTDPLPEASPRLPAGDLRHCLDLESNAEVARCAGRRIP